MMKHCSMKKMLSVILCIVLIAAMALCTTGCGSKETAAGSKTFTFLVVDLEGKETSFKITTEAATVGEALLTEKLIAGEDSEYGLYVKEVNGITADWDTDQTYWAFYVDGEYATAGVDATEINEEAVYSFVLTKG